MKSGNDRHRQKTTSVLRQALLIYSKKPHCFRGAEYCRGKKPHHRQQILLFCIIRQDKKTTILRKKKKSCAETRNRGGRGFSPRRREKIQ